MGLLRISWWRSVHSRCSGGPVRPHRPGAQAAEAERDAAIAAKRTTAAERDAAVAERIRAGAYIQERDAAVPGERLGARSVYRAP